MGRRKIEIKPIKDDRNRSVTFLKRKGGLFKKAHELSVLTSVEVAVIIFGQNNKLYEYSSSSLPEFLQRYNYARATYGGPHEQKTPDDFNRGGGDYDDDDDDNMMPEHVDSNSPPQHAMMPHLQGPQFQPMGTPSASPPMPNGAFHPHAAHHPHGTPQPISRPNSRSHMRHPSQPLQGGPPIPPPGVVGQRMPGPPPGAYTYTPNPPIYNPNAAQQQGMPPRSQPPPPPPPPNHFHYTSAPHQGPPPSGPPGPPPTQMQHPQQQQHLSPPQPMYQPPPQMPAVSQPPRNDVKIELSSPVDAQPPNHFNSPPSQIKALPASKTHSIFTPIEGSIFAKHWASGGGGDSTPDQAPKSDRGDKSSPPRSQSLDVHAIKHRQSNSGSPSDLPGKPNIPVHGPHRTASTPTLTSVPGMPPTRTNSLASDPKRPRLKVQIPNGESDDEKTATGTGATASKTGAGPISSPSDPSRPPIVVPANPAARNVSKSLLTPIREPGTAGPVLPPPSPSANSAYPLSAGATGPPNPFARPLPASALPTSSANTSGTTNSSTANAGSSSRDLETPISALPSRFMNGDFLPSPSSFYNEWGFGSGRDSAGGLGQSGNNMLPSPLTFQTPVNASGPSFKDGKDTSRSTSQERDANGGVKRKVDETITPVVPNAGGSSGQDKDKLTVESAAGKRIKT